jgi:hypothetical protein
MTFDYFGVRIIASIAQHDKTKQRRSGKETVEEKNKDRDELDSSPTVNRKRRKSASDTKEEFQIKVERYFSVFLTESGEIADIESLADYLGITRDEMIAMMNDRRYGKTLRLARNRIAKIKKQLAFGGKIPAAVLSFDLKNNHGYRDKPEDTEGNGHEQVVFKGKAADWAQ